VTNNLEKLRIDADNEINKDPLSLLGNSRFSDIVFLSLKLVKNHCFMGAVQKTPKWDLKFVLSEAHPYIN